jgi:hypothetical protein
MHQDKNIKGRLSKLDEMESSGQYTKGQLDFIKAAKEMAIMTALLTKKVEKAKQKWQKIK